MKKLITAREATSILLIYLLSLNCYGQTGNTWDKVRYNGGSVLTGVSPDDWGNRLSISSEEVKLFLKDGHTISIKPPNIVGLFDNPKLRYIGIVYNTDEGRKAGMLLQGHKDNYQAILQALKSVSGKEIETAASERQDIASHAQSKQPAKVEQPSALPKSTAVAESEKTAPKADIPDTIQNRQSSQNANQPVKAKTYTECKESMKSIAVASSSKIKEIRCGQEITVLSQDRNWARVRTGNGKEGYIPTKFITTK